MYTAHLGKARILLGLTTAWKTKAVVTAGHGLAVTTGSCHEGTADTTSDGQGLVGCLYENGSPPLGIPASGPFRMSASQEAVGRRRSDIRRTPGKKGRHRIGRREANNQTEQKEGHVIGLQDRKGVYLRRVRDRIAGTTCSSAVLPSASALASRHKSGSGRRSPIPESDGQKCARRAPLIR